MGNFEFDPFNAFKQISLQMEKQMNDSIKAWTNNKEFLGFTKMMSDIQMRYTEQFARNQEKFLEELNMPTKSDIRAVSSLAVQTEEKIDVLEEQVWDLIDTVSSVKEDLTEISKVSKQLATTNRQLKNEMSKLRKLVSEPSELEMLKEEITSLKMLILQKESLNGSKENKRLVAVGESN